MEISKINTKEKRIDYVSVLVLWILFSILFIIIILNNTNTQRIQSAKNILEQMEENNIKQHLEDSNMKNIDSLIILLSTYTNDNKNSHIESNIIYKLNEINKPENFNKMHNINIQANDFYVTLFYDKKATWNTLNNIIFLKENLTKCEIGFQQNQNNITLLETLQNNSKNK